MANWYLGTSAFSLPDWRGVFYPDDLNARDYLAYYSKIFNAVEIDSTFYSTPKADVVRNWAAETEPTFKICSKMPAAITHERELKDVRELVDGFMDSIRLLGDKLGVILIQFPPSFTISHFSDLDGFLADLPSDIRFAVEVRHRSWYQKKTEEMLARHKVAWASIEYYYLPKRIYQTASFLYVRFIGRHGRFRTFDSEKIDVTRQLVWWKEHLLEHADQVDSIYGFFNNDYAGFAAGTCNRFKEMMGFEVKPLNPSQQSRLF